MGSPRPPPFNSAVPVRGDMRGGQAWIIKESYSLSGNETNTGAKVKLKKNKQENSVPSLLIHIFLRAHL